MIEEVVEDDIRDLLSIQRYDYRKNKIKRIRKPIDTSIPPNIISEAFKEHLYSRRKNEKLPEHKRLEDPYNYLSKLHKKYPHLEKFLPTESPDEDVLLKEHRRAYETLYMVDISKSKEKYVRSKVLKKGGYRESTPLPAGWFVPETVYTYTHRNFGNVVSREELRRRPYCKQKNSLDPDEKERQIRRIKTEQTLYGETISALGKRLIEIKPYGPTLPLNPPRRWTQLKKKSSKCDAILKPVREQYVISNVFY